MVSLYVVGKHGASRCSVATCGVRSVERQRDFGLIFFHSLHVFSGCTRPNEVSFSSLMCCCSHSSPLITDVSNMMVDSVSVAQSLDRLSMDVSLVGLKLSPRFSSTSIAFDMEGGVKGNSFVGLITALTNFSLL